MKISFDKDEILSAIDRVAKKTMTMDLTWDWPCGVAYYGLAEAYKATGKTEYMEFLKNWVDEYIECKYLRNGSLPDHSVRVHR